MPVIPGAHFIEVVAAGGGQETIHVLLGRLKARDIMLSLLRHDVHLAADVVVVLLFPVEESRPGAVRADFHHHMPSGEHGSPEAAPAHVLRPLGAERGP